MRSLLVFTLLGVIALSTALPAGDAFEAEWAQYKVTHGKKYSGSAEEFLRRNIYQENKKIIDAHNAEYKEGKQSFTMGVNQFTDMPNAEYNAKMNRYTAAQKPTATATFIGLDDNVSLPTKVDWRLKGAVTAVKNQGQCGSCWAFSTTGSTEGQNAIKNKELISLSEQQLVDCAGGKWGNMGCNGGLMDQGFDYIKAVGGLEKESTYRYTAKDGSCKFSKTKVVVSISGHTDVRRGDENALKQAVATVGPISVAIDASHMSFQSYQGGIYNEPKCSSSRLDHGVLAVGYGTEGGKDYWLVKNSWTTSWGDEGYIKMTRNKNNQCGIATQASYPLL